VVAAGGDLVDSFAYWTFSDMFEEEGVPAAPFHGGFGLLTHRQIKKPIYHVYAFMARMGDEVLARGADHLVTRTATGTVTVLAWAPVDVTNYAAAMGGHTLSLSIPLGPPGARSAFGLRSSVSEEAGNAWRAWCEMGRPVSPRPRQYDILREAAEPARQHWALPLVAGRVDLDLTLARHEVTLVELTAVVDETPAWWDEGLLLGRRSEGEARP
jgi:xylan 1,4-beta-xylosidase